MNPKEWEFIYYYMGQIECLSAKDFRTIIYALEIHQSEKPNRLQRIIDHCKKILEIKEVEEANKS
jgi:hypothetical protein